MQIKEQNASLFPNFTMRKIGFALLLFSALIFVGYLFAGRVLVEWIYNSGKVLRFCQLADLSFKHPLAHYLKSADFLIFVIFPIIVLMGLIIIMYSRNLITDRTVLFIIIGFGVFARIFLALQSHISLQHWPLCDDSYYYFNIAKNIAVHGEVRHDSFNFTTGFQPLFMLLISPLFYLFQKQEVAINMVLILQTIIGIFEAIYLYKIVNILGNRKTALLATSLWSVSLFFISRDLNGLETGMAFLSLCFILYHYIAGYPNRKQGYSFYYKLGLFAGIGFLTRIDIGFLMPTLVIASYIREKKMVSLKQYSYNMIAFTLCWFLTVCPWFIINIISINSILPDSGHAVKFISEAFFSTNSANPAFSSTFLNFSLSAFSFKTAIEVLININNGLFPLWLALPVIIICSYQMFKERKTCNLLTFWPLLLFLFIFFFAYVFYVFGYWFYSRYFSPSALFYVLIIAACFNYLFEKPWWQRRGRYIGLFLIISFFSYNMVISGLKIYGTHLRKNPRDYYKIAKWINHNTNDDAVLGLFQSGIAGYYLERKFYGLDGKINRGALKAMEHGEIDKYVQNKKIGYLLDWPFIIKSLFIDNSQDKRFLEGKKEFSGYGFEVYGLGHKNQETEKRGK